MTGNPIEKDDPKYREKLVVALDDLCELDKLKVIQAERLFYRGLLPKHLRFSVQAKLDQFKRERMEEEAKEKMEWELYSEMMDDQGVSQSTRIKKELDAYEKMDDEEKMHSQFENIIKKVRGQRAALTSMHKERYSLIEEQLKLTMQKYPTSSQRKHREKQLKKGLVEIEEEGDNAEDQDEDEDEQQSAMQSQGLLDVLKSRRKKQMAFDDDGQPNADLADDGVAEEEIDFETYKKQFEAEMADKIRLERIDEQSMSDRILEKAKGLKYKIEEDDNQIIS